MRDSAKYAKIVEWSEEDQCYVSRTPGLIYAGCHGEMVALMLNAFVSVA